MKSTRREALKGGYEAWEQLSAMLSSWRTLRPWCMKLVPKALE